MEAQGWINRSRLINFEGFPSSGKTTNSENLLIHLKAQGVDCSWHHEMDKGHPIRRLIDTRSPSYSRRMQKAWLSFVERALVMGRLFIFESRLFQNSALDMLLDNHDEAAILAHVDMLLEVIAPMYPVLIYLDIDDLDTYIQNFEGRIQTEPWILSLLHARWFRERGIFFKHQFWRRPSLWLRPSVLFEPPTHQPAEAFKMLFETYRQLGRKLFDRFPNPKLRIVNPGQNWEQSYAKILNFLGA